MNLLRGRSSWKKRTRIDRANQIQGTTKDKRFATILREKILDINLVKSEFKNFSDLKNKIIKTAKEKVLFFLFKGAPFPSCKMNGSIDFLLECRKVE